jgi:hypothetical protein
MKYSYADIAKISGNADGDAAIADAFCAEVASETHQRAQFLKDLLDGKVILDQAKLSAAKDALIGVNHLLKLSSDVLDFHQRGQLAEKFIPLRQKVVDYKLNAAEIYSNLISLAS